MENPTSPSTTNTSLVRADCAAGVFSRTFRTSSQHDPPTFFPATCRKPSKNLPVELLLIVFHLVYADLHSEIWPWSRREDRDEREMSSSLFPYALASVCSLWRDTMSLVPKFWSRIVVLVDSPETPMSAVTSQLSWSRDVPLDIIITRRSFHNNADRHLERAQIVSVMTILQSHIHRIEELRFDVMFSSSLPSLLDDFRGCAPVMRRLELQCKVDDGGPDHSESVGLTEWETFECPKLTSFVIDGRNFYEACRRDTRWTDNKFAHVSELTISHFKPGPTESFTPCELLLPIAAMENIDSLCLVDLVLHPLPERILSLANPYNLGFLRFEEIHDFQVIHEITELLRDPFTISLTRCSLGGSTDGIGYFGSGGGIRGYLTLAEMMNQDMALFLRFWHGRSLDIRDCPGFNDVILDMMSSQEDGAFICAQYLQQLHIHNSPNFSILALQQLVESRLDFTDDYDSHNPTPTKLDRIYLRNVPFVSPEDGKWFVANVRSFAAY